MDFLWINNYLDVFSEQKQCGIVYSSFLSFPTVNGAHKYLGRLVKKGRRNVEPLVGQYDESIAFKAPREEAAAAAGFF